MSPLVNRSFGSPPQVVKSLWAGLMTWRRWRRFIQISEDLSLTDNFISRAHYMTEELLVHAGIIHQLALFLCFPHLDTKEYSLRSTGNRAIEAIHGVFRGGSHSLPITSPNLSFCEFLRRMTKTSQIRTAEHYLRHIEGNSIVATKKKRLTSAVHSTDASSASVAEYCKPATYPEYVEQLNQACNDGDIESKRAIERLAPVMAEALKAVKQFDQPKLAIDFSKPQKLVKEALHVSTTNVDVNLFERLITSVLGPISNVTNANNDSSQNQTATADVGTAIANLLSDISLCSSDEDVPQVDTRGNVTKALKLLQPHRERPSKDRSKRFAAGELHGDKVPHIDHDVIEFDYWLIQSPVTAVRESKLFLLGQILFMTLEGKPCHSACSTNPALESTFMVYEYDTEKYSPKGRTGLLKTRTTLLVNVTGQVSTQADKSVLLDLSMVTALPDGYAPFHADAELQATPQTTAAMQLESAQFQDDTYIVERVVARRFNRSQYEFLVKWMGYTEDENTWELAENIPEDKIQQYDAQCNGSHHERSLGKRTVKKPSKQGYINTF